ncbi:MAG: UPF0149 family protein [Pseudomonadota bacterium]
MSEFTPLNDEEMEGLDEFLLDRVTDEVYVEGKDEGVLGLSELDGFFTAIVSGPTVIPPSKWLPVVWGDFEPEWKDPQHFEAVVELMIRHMNGIAGTLLESPQEFLPMFLENAEGDATVTIVDEWCYGYMRGVFLALDEWDKGGEQVNMLLMPIMAFASEQGDAALKDLVAQDVTNIQQAITPSVVEIYAYWLARRQGNIIVPESAQRALHSIGRDEPCPCGSGKKYALCCLH